MFANRRDTSTQRYSAEFEPCSLIQANTGRKHDQVEIRFKDAVTQPATPKDRVFFGRALGQHTDN